MAGKGNKTETDSEEVKNVKIWIDALTDITEKLTPWEVTFVESLSDVVDRGSTLSPKQLERLEIVYRKHY